VEKQKNLKRLKRRNPMKEHNKNMEIETIRRKRLARRLDSLGWGLFFIWIGIAFLADVGWGVGFIGVGIIILGGLGGREYFLGSYVCRTTKIHC
jgi:hypothetical protein